MMKPVTPGLLKAQQATTVSGDKGRHLPQNGADASPKRYAVDTWSFQNSMHKVAEGEFPPALSKAFRAAPAAPAGPKPPQEAMREKFSVYGQTNAVQGSKWAAIIEVRNVAIASVTADGDDYKIDLVNYSGKPYPLSKEEMMAAIEDAKDDLDLDKDLPNSK